MILKSDAKFEEKLICCFKNNKAFVSFAWVLKSLKNLEMIGSFCAKDITFNLKKYRGVILHKAEEWCKIWRKIDMWSIEVLSLVTLNSDAKFEEKLTCGLENIRRNLASFHQSIWKTQNWNFDEMLLSIVENVWA